MDGACEDGVLIYVKPILLGTEPPDVASFASAFADFPHQSTADQFFNLSQTESYRMFGLHSIEEICRGWDGKSWESFAAHVTGEYLQSRPPTMAREASM
ncbi:MAG: hypothetical protein ABI806_11365 [Candidatus Solibacter sp.]